MKSQSDYDRIMVKILAMILTSVLILAVISAFLLGDHAAFMRDQAVRIAIHKQKEREMREQSEFGPVSPVSFGL